MICIVLSKINIENCPALLSRVTDLSPDHFCVHSFLLCQSHRQRGQEQFFPILLLFVFLCLCDSKLRIDTDFFLPVYRHSGQGASSRSLINKKKVMDREIEMLLGHLFCHYSCSPPCLARQWWVNPGLKMWQCLEN